MSNTLLAVDINSDMGERPEALSDGSEEQLMRVVTSANIACGGHAGDSESMEMTVRLAIKHGVCVGAHPGYPDKENFGRLEMQISGDEIRAAVYGQVRELAAVCKRLRCELRHVKPHGALYNAAVKNRDVALAIAEGVKRWSSGIVLVGLAGSEMLSVFRDAGFRVASEAFVDRAYEADGTLRSRKHDDALITDPLRAAHRAIEMVQKGTTMAIDGTLLQLMPTTLCIHSDTPNSSELARVLRDELRKAGIAVQPLTQLR